MITDDVIVAQLRQRGLVGPITADFIEEYRQHLGIYAICSALADDPELHRDFEATWRDDMPPPEGSWEAGVIKRLAAAASVKLRQELAA